MRALIIGRSAGTVDGAVARIRAHGFEVEGVTTDEAALAALGSARFGLLLIGGGVEKESRARLKDSAREHGVVVFEARRHGRSMEVFLREEVLPLLREQA